MDELGGETCCVARRTLTCTEVEVAQLCTVDCPPLLPQVDDHQPAQPVHVLLKACTGDALKTLGDPELVGPPVAQECVWSAHLICLCAKFCVFNEFVSCLCTSVHSTVWPEILAGNLFWRIGGFESNPPIFHPPKTSQCDVIIIAKS